jgi:hypothetical protein
MNRIASNAAMLVFVFLLPWQAYSDDSLPKLVRKIQPAVVTILSYDSQGKLKKQGSGFFINEGYFVTNYHVLGGAFRVEVKTSEGKHYLVKRIIAKDKTGDLIIAITDDPFLKFNVDGLKITPVIPEVGERVVVIGSPMGLEQTLSEGVVSAVRDIPDFGEIIQITAPVSHGSSGSPVVNMNGEVIGVATFILKEGQNLNFAIPGNRVLSLQQQSVKLPATTLRSPADKKMHAPLPEQPKGESITISGKLTKKGFDREDGTVFYTYYISSDQGKFLLWVDFNSEERKKIVKAEKQGLEIKIWGYIEKVVAGANKGDILKTPEGYKIIKVKYTDLSSKGITTIVKDIDWSETGDSLVITTEQGDYLLYMWGENQKKAKRMVDILVESKQKGNQIIIYADKDLIEDVRIQKKP